MGEDVLYNSCDSVKAAPPPCVQGNQHHDWHCYRACCLHENDLHVTNLERPQFHLC